MKFTLLLLLTFSTIACSQNSRNYLGKDAAQQELKEAPSNHVQHNNVDNKNLIIKNSKTVVNIAEPILFDMFGKENIEKQKPYEMYLLDEYWIISGTLTTGYKGGTFLIIIDGRNAKVLKSSHGK